MQMCKNENVQVCKCASMQMCKYANVLKRKCASVQMCKCANVQVCKCASMQMCKYANVRVCKCASMQLCKCESIPICKCVRMCVSSLEFSVCMLLIAIDFVHFINQFTMYMFQSILYAYLSVSSFWIFIGSVCICVCLINLFLPIA